MRYTLIVSTLPETLVLNVDSGRDAGPLTTAPERLNCEPWHWHSYVWFWKVLTVHCSCVHVAVSAENAFCAVRATRNDRPEAFTSAASPTVARAPLSTLSVIVLFAMEPLIVGSAGNPLGPPGDVGLLPPHPVSAATAAPSESTSRE